MNEEELNEAIEYNSKYMEAMLSEEIFGGDYTSSVELEYANKEIEKLQEENQQLEEKIDKAIEYINRKDICIDIRDNNLNFISTNELLEILKGEDNNGNN